jgi:molecular chaperone DnaJ
VSSGHDWFSAPTLTVIATHYETLGVRPDATAAEIRAAYLTRARQQHPDVSGPVAASSGSMVELNHAYQVLRRDHTRAEYDRQLRRPSAPTTAEPEAPPYGFDDDGEPIPPSPASRAVTRILTPGGPARMPWKLMAVAAVLGSIVILVSAAFVQSPKDEAPDGILRVGSCVSVEPNGDVREVACGPDAELVVRLLIPTDATCPSAYMPRRDRLGLGTACVEPYTGLTGE